MKASAISVYTDGSCHTQLKAGGWAAILFWGKKKIILKGEAQQTTHNRMELLAVINAIDFVVEKDSSAIISIFSDSQYVVQIPVRKDKLKSNLFITKKGNELQNSDLVQKLIFQIENYNITFTKVKAHLKTGETPNYNREVDIIVREIVREQVKQID